MATAVAAPAPAAAAAAAAVFHFRLLLKMVAMPRAPGDSLILSTVCHDFWGPAMTSACCLICFPAAARACATTSPRRHDLGQPLARLRCKICACIVRPQVPAVASMESAAWITWGQSCVRNAHLQSVLSNLHETLACGYCWKCSSWFASISMRRLIHMEVGAK